VRSSIVVKAREVRFQRMIAPLGASCGARPDRVRIVRVPALLRRR